MVFISDLRYRLNCLICLALQASFAVVAFSGGAQAADSKSARPAAAASPKAPPASPKAAPADPWVVICSTAAEASTLQCQASQNLTESKTGQRVLTVTIRKEGGDKAGYAMLLALPHGLFLPAGITYQVDGGRQSTAVIETSDRNGTYAAVPLSADVISAMKAGTDLDVGMESVTRKKVVIPVSLSGFTTAVGKLQTIK